MATLTEQLDAMRSLRPNWDGYGADPTDPAVVEMAKGFVAFFEQLERDRAAGRSIRVYPTRAGGVQIEWDDARYERELELHPDGSIGLLHVEKATGATREETFRPTGLGGVMPVLLPTLGEMAALYAGAA